MSYCSRREFLILSAATGAGFLAQHMLPTALGSTRLRAAIVGLDPNNLTLLKTLSYLPGIEVTALYDRSWSLLESASGPSSIKVSLKPKVYSNPHHLLEQSAVDFAIVSLPADNQGEVIQHAVDRGVSIIVETPLAPDLDSSQVRDHTVYAQLLPRVMLSSNAPQRNSGLLPTFDTVEIVHDSGTSLRSHDREHLKQWLMNEAGDVLDAGVELLEAGEPDDCAICTSMDRARNMFTCTARYAFKSNGKRKYLIVASTAPLPNSQETSSSLLLRSTLTARGKDGAMLAAVIPRTADMTSLYVRNLAAAIQQRDRGLLIHSLDYSLQRTRLLVNMAASNLRVAS